MTSKQLFIFMTAALVITGSCMMAHSGYFYTRAVIMQMLLNEAWEKSKRTKKIVKVWGLADTWPVGKLSIKSIGLSKVLLKDADKESLAIGPAHIAASAWPGSDGNIAIAGHRDSFFSDLEGVRRGEVVELESMSSVQYFTVTDIQIADPGDIQWAENAADNVITLITCYPFHYVGPAPKRYVVRGKSFNPNNSGVGK
jgi:sortase A